MSWADVFGELIDGDDVEAAVLAHLQKWEETHLAAAMALKDPDSAIWPEGVSELKSYTVVHAANDNWPEDQLPMQLVYAPGLAEPPVSDGEGGIDVRYSCLITSIASGFDQADSKKLARLYASVGMLSMLQDPSLSGFARAVHWVDLNNFPVTRGVRTERNLMAVTVSYIIDVPQVIDVQAGVKVPLADPGVEPEVADPPNTTHLQVNPVAALAESGWFNES